MSLKLMPQEVEVWYLLPSLRKELAKVFIEDHNLSQREVAKILGITESAISQYLKDKRANSLKFTKQDILQIKKTADQIINDRKNSRIYFYELSKKLRGSQSMCDLHKKHDKNLPSNCDMCRRE
ncbi:MAG TPA: helix-turn-helix domain-containing protein [Candidatus Nanoarchaeia archaeon]|nr:helix-turn-helix domain-containing protein [Candidatus Nanoarchaeia archaeon]